MICAHLCEVYDKDMTACDDSFDNQEKITDAVNVARMYYYQGMKTEVIAREMNMSRSTVSRLLTFARENGLVDIHVIDPNEKPQQLERKFLSRYNLKHVLVVSVTEMAGEAAWLDRVAHCAATHLNTMFDSKMVLGIAWGTTLTAVSKYLLKKTTYNSNIIQLNGAGNTQSTGIDYAGEIIARFANNYTARAHLFPVPTYFDYPETKVQLWKEGSIKHILELQNMSDLLLYSIGAVNAGVPSHVHTAGYLNKKDYAEIEKQKIVGDIATVFFREDGSFDNIPINDRASGPSLDFFQKKYGICVVSGLAKIAGLCGALNGKLLKELIIDEPTARKFAERYSL
jgi:deoxyribonucleoside regulator